MSLSFSKDPVQVMVAPGNVKSIFILSPSTTHFAGMFSLLDASRAAVLSENNSIAVLLLGPSVIHLPTRLEDLSLQPAKMSKHTIKENAAVILFSYTSIS